MSFSKMSISKRIVTGYVIFFLILIIISVFVIAQNALSVSRANVLVDNNDSNGYIGKALNNFLNSRVGARIIMMSDNYDISVYNDTITQLDDTLDFISQSLEIEESYEATENIRLLSDTSSKVERYKDTVTSLNNSNARKNEYKNNMSVLGSQAVDPLHALVEYENTLASGQAQTSTSYDNFNELSAIELDFYNVRLLVARLLYLDEIDSYDNIINLINSVNSSLENYRTNAPAARRSDITATIDSINTYASAIGTYREIVLQTEEYTNLCVSIYNEVRDSLEKASNTLNQDLIIIIQKIVNSAKGSLITVSILMVLALIINISLAVIIVKSINRALNNAMEKLKAATNNVISSSSELTNAANSLAQSSTEQAASIEETSATMNETASMINQNNQNTRQAVDLAKNADVSATASVAQAEGMIEFMKKLNNSSDQINKIISTINSIASQTTILALNASVEAVRAGEAGKSFSVVAEEVRHLAQQSTLAVESTTAIIRENIELSKQGMENSKEVGETLDGIHTDSEKVAQLLDEIATASEEQANGVTQINIAMSQMEKVTQSIAAVSEQSAAAASELYSQAGILEEVTEELGTLIGM